MTQQREEFEAWAKSKHLDVDYKEKDAWGRELYTPHIQSMWTGWQAAQAAQPAQPEGWKLEVEPVAGVVLRDGWPTLTRFIQETDTRLYTAPPDTEAMRRDAELGRVAMRFVDRAGDVHPGIDDAETICADFYKAMCAAIEAQGGAT